MHETAVRAQPARAGSPEDELRMFRNLVRSLTRDAARAVRDLETWCRDAEHLERCQLVHRYLDYMTRLCDGAA